MPPWQDFLHTENMEQQMADRNFIQLPAAGLHLKKNKTQNESETSKHTRYYSAIQKTGC